MSNNAISEPVENQFGTGSHLQAHASNVQADASGLNLKTDTRQANWRRQNSDKYRAHLAVQRALTSGELEKGPCEVCGTTDGRIDAHHDDYAEPLAVRWLCRQHHIRLHGGGEDLFTAAFSDDYRLKILGKEA